jgi:hypothetical protein
MGQAVAGDFVARIQAANFAGFDAAVPSEESAVEVKAALKSISVENSHKPPVGDVTVVVAERKGFI